MIGTTIVPSPALPPPDDGTAGRSAAVDWLKVIRGNWVGSALVALATAFTAGFLGLVLALLAKPDDFGLSNTLTLATVLATAAFGADLQAEASASTFFTAGVDASVGVFPFTITLVSLAVAVYLFRRVTRRYASGVDTVTDAVRTALIFGICLWVPALIFRSDNDELGRGWGSELDATSLGMQAEVGANAGGALCLGFLILGTVLVLTALMRSDLWKTQDASRSGLAAVLRAREWIAAPLAGVATLAVLLPVAGAIGFLAVGLGGQDNDVYVSGDQTRLAVAACIAFLANGGLWVLSIGSGSRFGALVDSSSGSEEQWERLSGQISSEEPGLWVSPVVLIAVLALAALVVVRTSSRATALRSLAVWTGLLLLAMPLFMRLTSVHARGQAQAEGESFDGSMYWGPDGVQTTLLVILTAAVVAFAVAMARGVLDPAAVKGSLGRAGRSIQRPVPTDNRS